MGLAFVLPVAAVVETMHAFPQMMLLEATFPSLRGLTKEPCVAQILLGQGQVPAYSIVASTTGAVLCMAQEAYHALEQCGDVSWRLVAAPASHTRHAQEAPSSPAGSAVPAVRPPVLGPFVTEAWLSSLPHSSRQVLRLVDGRRSVAEIAWLLHKSPQEVASLLAALPDMVV